jgi:hypothetical protein
MKVDLQETSVSLTILVVGFLMVSPTIASSIAQEEPAKSNLSALGKALVLYSEDADNLLPLAYAPSASLNQWRIATMIRVPQGWEDGPSKNHKAEDAVAWPNSGVPYFKSLSKLEATGYPLLPMDKVGKALSQPAKVGFSLNGLLHAFQRNSIQHSGRVPLLWQGRGLVNLRGLTIANPSLQCPMTLDCRYGQANNKDAIMWAYSKPEVKPDSIGLFLTADLSLQARKLNRSSIENPQDKYVDPYRVYKGNEPQEYWECTSPNAGLNPCMFMPDNPTD